MIQMINFLRLRLDAGWKTELKDKVNWDKATFGGLKKIMNKVLKGTFNLF